MAETMASDASVADMRLIEVTFKATLQVFANEIVGMSLTTGSDIEAFARRNNPANSQHRASQIVVATT
jgi:hypothetical protein